MRILPALILILYTSTVVAQTTTKQAINDKGFKKAIQAAEKYIDSLRISQNIPGISVAVGNKEKILWAKGFGYADLENGSPVTMQSMFRVGSVSKVITSVAVGRLYEQGKLDLDAPIQKYLPDYPQKQYVFTARQLAAHTAGIRHYRNDDPIAYPKRYNNVTEGLTIFSNDSLLFKPGTASNYSTYGYSLLSAVVESAAGTSFLSYMRDSIFLPLNMPNTIADYNDSIIKGRVRFYENRNGGVVNAALVDNSYKWAGGGFLSTPADLVNMTRALLNQTFLSKSSTDLLFTEQKLENGTSTNVGIGWRINETKSGVKYIHHGGLSDGGRTFVLFFPESGYAFAIAANTSAAKLNIDEAITVLDFFREAK